MAKKMKAGVVAVDPKWPIEQVEASVAVADVPVKAVSDYQKRINESRQVLSHPKPAGQKFFESPEGHIIAGEADATEVWCAQTNGGKGGYINPRR